MLNGVGFLFMPKMLILILLQSFGCGGIHALGGW